MERKTIKQGRYHILRSIGKGKRSEVYLAEDTTTGQQVALKLLQTDMSSSQREAWRFFQYEIKAIARLCSPGILPVLDYGEESISGAQFTFIVMPYCPEGSLSAWLENAENCKALSLQDVASILCQVADALQYAHEHGMIHQNVKPSNLLFSGNASFQHLLLSDFSIASFSDEPSQAEQIAASLAAYMAPEQWQGQPVFAADQYALAGIAYLLLTGRPPFQGNAGELMKAHINMLPAPPSAINPILSQGIDSVLLRALEKAPGDRFTTISAFADAFEQIIQPMAAPAMVTPVPTVKLRMDWAGSGPDALA